MQQDVLTHALTFLVGALLGHRLSLLRDVRKEINEVAQAVRATLLKERSRVSPLAAGLSETDIDLLHRLLPAWRRRGFRRAVERYKDSKRGELARDPSGGAAYRNPDAVREAIDRLLRYTARR